MNDFKPSETTPIVHPIIPNPTWINDNSVFEKFWESIRKSYNGMFSYGFGMDPALRNRNLTESEIENIENHAGFIVGTSTQIRPKELPTSFLVEGKPIPVFWEYMGSLMFRDNHLAHGNPLREKNCLEDSTSVGLFLKSNDETSPPFRALTTAGHGYNFDHQLPLVDKENECSSFLAVRRT